MKALKLTNLFHYPGGKGQIAPFILSYLPQKGFTRYCEPFAGGASIFWKREPCPEEILNDIDPFVIAFYRILQSPTLCEQAVRTLLSTPYAFSLYREWNKRFWHYYDAFRLSQQPIPDNPFEMGMSLFFARNSTFSGLLRRNEGSWARVLKNAGKHPASTFHQRIVLFYAAHRRIRHVTLLNEDALSVIPRYDSPTTLFYLDPPYILESRVDDRPLYFNEPNNDFHHKLCDLLLACQGGVALSAYEHPLYHRLLENGWKRAAHHTVCHMSARIRQSRLYGAGNAKNSVARTEWLYLNPKAFTQCPAHLPLEPS